MGVKHGPSVEVKLKLYGQIAKPIGRPASALRRLKSWLPNGVARVLETLARNGARGVVVGGAVRSAFLGVEVSDWDVATDAIPGDVASWFQRVVRAGEKHGTIMVITGDGPVEVTTFRSEGEYHDGRRPSSVDFVTNLDADLERRDFTVNAMAADLDAGTLEDPFGGREDIERRRIRCVGDPAERFDEDGLRPLRAVRFSAVLDFAIHPQTRAAIRPALRTFDKVAWERKRDELESMLARAVALPAAGRALEQTGLLARLAPELRGLSAARWRALGTLPLGQPWLRFAGWASAAGLSADVAAEVLTRWRVSTKATRAVAGWIEAVEALPRRAPRGADLREWIATVSPEAASGAALLAEALRGFERFGGRVRATLGRGGAFRVADLAVDGSDLMALGLRGPRVGQVLEGLLAAVLKNPRTNQRERLLELAHTLSTASPTDKKL